MDDIVSACIDPFKGELIVDEMFKPRWDRNTGKTYRQVLRSLCKASEKDQTICYYLSNTVPHRDHAFKMAQGICMVTGIGEVMPAKREIRLPNNTVLKFMVPHNYDALRGTRAEVVIVDQS